MCKQGENTNYYKSMDYKNALTAPYGKCLVKAWKDVLQLYQRT